MEDAAGCWIEGGDERLSVVVELALGPVDCDVIRTDSFGRFQVGFLRSGGGSGSVADGTERLNKPDCIRK